MASRTPSARSARPNGSANSSSARSSRTTRLICTSRAVLRMVKASADAYAEYLRERVGGDPRVRMRLEVIPLGVDTDRYHPPSPGERAARREALGIGYDEVAVLFVGRLSHHTKAHPFPLFHAVDHAARETRQKVHLILAGWAHNPIVFQAFRDGGGRRRAQRPGVVRGRHAAGDPVRRLARRRYLLLAGGQHPGDVRPGHRRGRWRPGCRSSRATGTDTGIW